MLVVVPTLVAPVVAPLEPPVVAPFEAPVVAPLEAAVVPPLEAPVVAVAPLLIAVPDEAVVPTDAVVPFEDVWDEAGVVDAMEERYQNCRKCSLLFSTELSSLAIGTYQEKQSYKPGYQGLHPWVIDRLLYG